MCRFLNFSYISIPCAEVSGVMAVVLLGVTISAQNTCISPEVEHAVHQFWEMMSFFANTVLFVILGIVISETAINSFELSDGIHVIWLYFALNIIR
jgi:sodium/hydrogen exchanger 10/11